MLEVIEKLLILQDRDRKILQLQSELETIGPQRQAAQSKSQATQTAVEEVRLKSRHLESDRKKLELEVDALKERIERYALQQFQTKKNEEYRALAHEIDTCKAQIVKLEDQQLELMELAETAHREVAASAQQAAAIKQDCDRQLSELATRETALQKFLAEAVAGRDQLASAVAEAGLAAYERLRKKRGDRVVVGVEHGACGGCHMKLPAQVVLACRGAQEIVMCPNCARILYYSRDMDMVVAE